MANLRRITEGGGDRLCPVSLDLRRCPFCKIADPNLHYAWSTLTNNRAGEKSCWAAYICASCGGVVTALLSQIDGTVFRTIPAEREAAPELPDGARDFLNQAIGSIHSAPSGAQMLSASAVDDMLKEKGLVKGSLYSRIDQAAEQHLITQDMKEWAHEVRLEANNPRHADRAVRRATPEDAQRCVDFADALGEFLFVLPARIRRGRDVE